MKELEDQTRVRSILRLEHGNQAIRITEWHVRGDEYGRPFQLDFRN